MDKSSNKLRNKEDIGQFFRDFQDDEKKIIAFCDDDENKQTIMKNFKENVYNNNYILEIKCVKHYKID